MAGKSNFPSFGPVSIHLSRIKRAPIAGGVTLREIQTPVAEPPWLGGFRDSLRRARIVPDGSRFQSPCLDLTSERFAAWKLAPRYCGKVAPLSTDNALDLRSRFQ
jgi:hypothetical protein